MQKWQILDLHQEFAIFDEKTISEAQLLKFILKIRCKYFFPNIVSDLF